MTEQQAEIPAGMQFELDRVRSDMATVRDALLREMALTQTLLDALAGLLRGVGTLPGVKESVTTMMARGERVMEEKRPMPAYRDAMLSCIQLFAVALDQASAGDAPSGPDAMAPLVLH